MSGKDTAWEALRHLSGHPAYLTVERYRVPSGWLYRTTTWYLVVPATGRENSPTIAAQQVVFVPSVERPKP